MNSELEQSFVKQLQENQNIIHKICRLYTEDEDAHKDLFQEITIQLWNKSLCASSSSVYNRQILWIIF